jgi:hypothetical protein
MHPQGLPADTGATAVIRLGKGLVMATPVSRQWVIDMLRRLEGPQVADEASRDLPDPVDAKQLQEYAERHNLSVDELIDRMGGSQ